MMTTLLVIFVCLATVMTLAYIVSRLDRCKAASLEQQEKLGKQYRTLYKNIEQKHGYCAARQAARQPGYEAQMFKLEPQPADVKSKSIEVF